MRNQSGVHELGSDMYNVVRGVLISTSLISNNPLKRSTNGLSLIYLSR